MIDWTEKRHVYSRGPVTPSDPKLAELMDEALSWLLGKSASPTVDPVTDQRTSPADPPECLQSAKAE